MNNFITVKASRELVYYFFLIFSLVFVFLLNVFYDLQILSLIKIYSILYFFSWLCVRDPFSPFVFLNLFLFLYSISFPLLLIFSGASSLDLNKNLKIIVLSGLVIFFASAVVGGLREIFLIKVKRVPEIDLSSKIVAFLVVLTFVFFAYSVVQVLGSGAEKKYELATSDLSGVMVYFFLTYSFVYSTSINENKTFKVLVLFNALFLFYYLVTGERDYFVRFALMTLAFAFYSLKIDRKNVILVYVVGFFVLPLSQSLKGFFSYGGAGLELSLGAFFSGEFMSQGRNFYWMLVYEQKMASVYDNLIFNDILRFFKLSDYSSTSVFGREVVGRSGGSGLGFSIPGALYFSGGYFGLFFFGFIIFLFANSIYTRLRLKNGVHLCFFITMLFSIAYSMRADFANLLAGVFKIGLVPIIFLLVFERFFKFSVMSGPKK